MASVTGFYKEIAFIMFSHNQKKVARESKAQGIGAAAAGLELYPALSFGQFPQTTSFLQNKVQWFIHNKILKSESR